MPFKPGYYALLNIDPTATGEEIRQAYRHLAKQYHPDLNPEPEAQARFKQIQEAYDILSDPLQRKKYTQWRIQQGLDQLPALQIETIPSHQVIPSLAEEQAYYLLLTITPADELLATRLPLNVGLAVDHSTSMAGARLKHVKEAISHIINRLQPQDALSLVTFSDRAEVLLSGQTQQDKAKAQAIISTIQAGGGTEMLAGLSAALKQVRRSQTRNTVNHLILLTDGQTYGDEEQCLQQARWAGEHQITLSTIGIGTDWNEELLDHMASLAGGISTYLDSAQKVRNIFAETIKSLENIVAREMTLTLNLASGVNLHQAHQIDPQITPLENRGDTLKLGPLSREQHKTLLLEFRLKQPTPGQQRLMRLHLAGDVPVQGHYRPWEAVELSAEVKNDPPQPIPAAITDVLSKLAIFKMQEKVATDLKENRIDQATQRLEMIATRLLDIGESELANAALLEAGQVSQKGELSEAGRKKIRYGTRVLTALVRPAD